MFQQIRNAGSQIVDVVCEPSAAVAKIADLSNVNWAVIVIVGLVWTITQMIETHFISASMLLSVPAAQKALIQSAVERGTVFSLVAAPCMLFIKCWIVAAILLVASGFAGLAFDFKRIFSLVLLAQTILLMGRLLALIVLVITHGDSMHGIPALGLNMLWHVTGWGGAIASLLNPFSIWFCAVLALGISQLGKISITRASGIVGVYAGMATIFAVTTAAATHMVGLR